MISKAVLEKTGKNSGKIHLSKDMKKSVERSTRHVYDSAGDYAVLLSGPAVEIYSVLSSELYPEGKRQQPSSADVPPLLMVDIHTYENSLKHLRQRASKTEAILNQDTHEERLYYANTSTVNVFKNLAEHYTHACVASPEMLNRPLLGDYLKVTSKLEDSFYQLRDYVAVGELDIDGIGLWPVEMYLKRGLGMKGDPLSSQPLLQLPAGKCIDEVVNTAQSLSPLRTQNSNPQARSYQAQPGP